MTHRFDLSTEPWIPCEDLDGRRLELGLHDAIVRAHELRGLSDPSPLVLAALYRTMLAVIHRAVDGPRNMKAWVALMKAGRFPDSSVADYLARVRDRLDLFHATHPFAQTRGLPFEFDDMSKFFCHIAAIASRPVRSGMPAMRRTAFSV